MSRTPPRPLPRSVATRRHVLVSAAAGAASLALPSLGLAQAYPSRPIRYICPWPAGGSTDAVIRAFAESAQKTLGQQIIVENKPGGGGMLGATELVTALPDGYTLSQLPHGVFRIPHMRKAAFDTLSDFTWIACLTGYTFGLVVPADGPIKSIADLVAYAKANPGKFNYGSTGTGTSPHLAVEEFAQRAGIQLNHVPFKGNADNMQAMLGGHVMAASDATGWDKFVDDGRMRLLVTFGEARTPRWPDVPTAKDLGYNVVSQSPYGLVGPKGMDPAVVAKLHDAFKQAMDTPEHAEVMKQLNQAVWYRNGADYKAWAVDTFAKDKALIERLGLAAK